MTRTVSIVMPIHNLEGFVAAAIGSVQQQSYRNWELIVVDDGSTDGTREVVRPLLADPRIRLVEQPASGVAAARNRGLELAGGTHLAFLDGDDLWDPRFLDACLARLTSTGAGLVFTAHGNLRPDGSTRSFRPRYSQGATSAGECLRALIPWHIALLMGNVVLLRTEAVGRLRFSTGCIIGEDTEYFIRVLCCGPQVCFLDEEVFHYRERDGSITRQRWGWAQRRQCLDAMDRARAVLAAHYLGADRAELLALFDKLQSFRRCRTLYDMIKRRALWECRRLVAAIRWRCAPTTARRPTS